MFDSKKKWQNFLKQYCFNVLSKREGYFVDSIDKISDTPSEPSSWIFSEKGLSIRFTPYEVAPYSEGEPEVLVPWSVLKPFLVADPVTR